MITDPIVSWEHLMTFFAGSTALALVGHAVNTFPTPSNPYGQWLLGVIKFAVGQRQSAANAMRGQDTVVVAVPQGTGSGTGTGEIKKTEQSSTIVTPDKITTDTEKTIRTSVSVPNPNPNPPDKP